MPRAPWSNETCVRPFRNILTDGERLYLTDFGLANSPRFALSTAEREFLARHRTHDERCTVTQLVNWVVTALMGAKNPLERNELIREYAETGAPPDLPPSAAAIVERHAATAVVMNEFYRKLHTESRMAEFPG